MAFSETYCDPVNGDNTNGGSDAGSPSMSDTAGTGSWVSATHIYTSVATNGAVAVGQYLSIYSGAAAIAAYTARITAVSGGSGSAWVITVSSTAFAGAVPTTGATFKAKVGGAWKGPNAAVSFPFNYMTFVLLDAAGDDYRVNLKNNATYNITATINQTLGGGTYEGYTTTPGDGGKAVIDGGTSGAYYNLFTLNQGVLEIANIVFQNNGATSTPQDGFVNVSGNRVSLRGVCVNHVSGDGFNYTGGSSMTFTECEAYSCGLHGFATATIVGGTYTRCISHNNTTNGFLIAAGSTLIDCISAANGGTGITCTSITNVSIIDGYYYGNTGSGISISGSQCNVYMENVTFDSNTSWGVIDSSLNSTIRAVNCAFYNNGAGTISGVIHSFGTVTLAASPAVAASTGNFNPSTTASGTAVKGAGRGNYTQNNGSYTGTQSYPSIGGIEPQATSSHGGFF